MPGTVLITGGAGFIGSHVADLFLEQGWRVAIVDNLSTGKRENVPAAAAFHELDIRSPDAAELIRGGRFDVLVHLAAQMDVRRSVDDPVYDAQVNIEGTLRLAEAVRRSGAGTRIVFASSGGAIYGDTGTPPNAEETAKAPQSPYGVSKLSGEYYLTYYGRVHGVEAAALRFANVYGPRQDPHGEAGVVAIFCGRVIDGASLTIFGDGRQTRDYVYVGDVARSVWLAATRPAPSPTTVDSRGLNIGTGVETTVIELAHAIQRVAGRRVEMTFAPSRAGEALRSAVTIDKTAVVLGWRPEVSLDDGLSRTYRWFAARRAAPQPA